MKLGSRTLLILLAVVWTAFAPALTVCAAQITVFAAASLSDSLKRIATDYRTKSEDDVVFNFGASSTLERQIEEGAPADIFFSADEAKMDALEKKGLIVKETRKSRLSNTLVIVVAADSTLKITAPADLASAGVRRIALADPKAVPAGIYSREYLEKRNLWSTVQDKVVPTEDVRAALAAVESGNVEAGMVYKTDAAISSKVKVACEIPAGQGPAISYPVAVVREGAHLAAARKFLAYLDSTAATRVFQDNGFVVLK